MTQEVGQSTDEGQEAKKIESAEELRRQLEEERASKQRILEESIKHKKKAQEIEQRYEMEQLEKANKSGDLQKQLELKNKMLEKVQGDFKMVQQKTIESNIRSTLLGFSDRFNVDYLDDILNQPKYAHILNEGIDRENLTINKDTAAQYLDAILDEKPIFKRQVQSVGVVAKKPSGFDPNAGKKAIKDMNPDELKRFILENYKR